MQERGLVAAGLLGALLGALGCAGTATLPDGGSGNPAESTGCKSAAECRAGEVCAPATNRCTAELSCKGPSDCGRAAFCGTDGRCAPSETGSPCTTNDNCPAGESCVGGFCGCKGESYQGQRVSANVLIVLDRSRSMTEMSSSGSKWEVAKQAIKDLLAAQGSEIRFGLAAYPATDVACSSRGMCEPGTVFVAPAEGSAAAIASFLDTSGTCIGTPTAETLSALAGYVGLKDATRANYVLLITDGQATCADPAAVVASLRNQTPEIKTFVVGFGDGVNANELNSMAQQGGTAISSSPPYYYVAGDAQSLASAFSSIAGTVLSCSYTLSAVPQDLAQLYVYQAKQAIARDTTHQNGWDYDTASNQLTFYGEACTALSSGKVGDLAIVYGCQRDVD